MDYKMYVVASFIILVVGGFLLKLKQAYELLKRREKVSNFRNTFVDLVNQLLERDYFNSKLYYECITQVDEIQIELGTMGIASYIRDGLHGIQGNNIPILVNYLPEIRSYAGELDNFLVRERLHKNNGLIDDLLVRYISCLDAEISRIKGSMFNPFACFAFSIKSILTFPLFILSSFGILSDTTTTRVYGSFIFKIISGVFSLVTLISGIVTIVVGWDKFSDFLQKIYIFFRGKI